MHQGTVMPHVRQAPRILCGNCKILSAAYVHGVYIYISIYIVHLCVFLEPHSCIIS